MAPSATLEMSRRSGELKARGVDVIDLSIGEPDFDTPDHIKAAAVQAIEANYTRYTPVAGYASLREAVCDKLQRENGLVYSPSEIVVSNGAKQSICNTILSLVNDGDEVIIPAPYWVSYPQMTLLAGGKPVVIETDIAAGFKVTPEQLEKAITPKSRLIILCSPSNPTGGVYSQKELQALARVVTSHEGLYVISDEIYEHLDYVGSHASIAACEGMRERTVIVNGVSKAYAMTGWRIGYIAAPSWIAAACSKLQGQFTGGPSSISQKAAEAALRADQSCVERMRQAFKARRDLLISLIKDIPGLEVNQPEGAFYLLPKCSAYFGKSAGGTRIENSTDLALYLLDEAHVAVVGGEGFGAPGYFRISYSLSEESIREAVRRIGKALEKLV